MYLCSFSLGSWAVMFVVSSLMPKKVKTVRGGTFLLLAFGIFNSLQSVMNDVSACERCGIVGAMKRKSSRTFITFCKRKLFCRIHLIEFENVSNILHKEEQPIGRNLS